MGKGLTHGASQPTFSLRLEGSLGIFILSEWPGKDSSLGTPK